MSNEYRVYPDNWRNDITVKDESADVSAAFDTNRAFIEDISSIMRSKTATADQMEDQMQEEMVKVIFGSNNIERVGLGYDETFRLCLAVFRGECITPYPARSIEYQSKLEELVKKDLNLGESAIVRGRREVVQHAAAFQHLLEAFVKFDQPITEGLIKETHRILTTGLSGTNSGHFDYQDFGGKYRKAGESAFGGSHEFAKPSEIPKAMNSLVQNLANDIETIETTRNIDPFMLAASYCDRFVNIHPFRDGNGRMCRMILNAILVKYSGIVVALGGKDQDRDEYLLIAQESAKVGGHAGQLAKLVLDSAQGTLKKLKNKLSRR
ncbi:uncharacterized protein EAF01_007520 [Botrytis porri]|uniref:Fido domain-containing protein n=1 Tax=Botrytis porri TaxID=87229 RepID=A0A4Z1K5K3_9HELO|nr:uncharacterized protein EAF01_007520 [Botrytis porri]KAF7900218.1 hypothetical protein EAF01_007520 [Botrytis porri]TGO80814.1 hypothetical protein BPOR_1692g00010 [Botrytis porri]